MSSKIKRPVEKQQPTLEEHERGQINEAHREVVAMDAFTHGQRRTFAVGDAVCFGFGPCPDSKVVENVGGGVYRIESPDGHQIIRPWFSIYHSLPEEAPNYGKSAYRLEFVTRDIGGLIEYGRSGVEMNPAYQRDLVWNDHDRQSLLTSVMSGVDIGKFVFAMNNFVDILSRLKP